MSGRLALICAILTVAPFAQAQAPDPAAQAQLIQQLLQRIDRLENRVTELESGKTVTLVAKTPAAAPVIAQPGEHDHGTPVEPPTTFPSLRLSGFGDVNFVASDQRGVRSGFNEGQFILHISSALSSRVTYFGELSMAARTDAGTGSPAVTGFNVEVERSIVRLDQSDHLKLSFGRYHTPISYWNTAFHHGSWLQTTASRPEMVQFGGSFIPVHFVGTLAEGQFSAKGLNLNYNAGIGNGRSSVLSRAGDFGDINNNRAWLANAFIKPDKLYGLQVGGAVYRDKINVVGRPETREWISSAHIVWNKENPEFIAEFFNVNHRSPGSTFSFNSQSWYAQLAYRLPFANQWKPYYRYEYIHIPTSDLVYRGIVSNLSGSTLGVRYDFSSFAAFKLEYRNQERPGLPRINVAWAQTSFTF
jgi:hypothetical protein